MPAMNLLSKLALWLWKRTPEARASRLRRSEASRAAWAKRHEAQLRMAQYEHQPEDAILTKENKP